MSEIQHVGPVRDMPACQGGGSRPDGERGQELLPVGAAFPRDAPVPRTPAVPGGQLPDAAGHHRRRRRAVGAAQRGEPGVHGRVPDGLLPFGSAHRRSRSHDHRGGQPLVRRWQHRRAPDRSRPDRRRRLAPAAVLHQGRAPRSPRLPGGGCAARFRADLGGRTPGDRRGAGGRGPQVGRRAHSHRLPEVLAGCREDGRAQDGGSRPVGGRMAARAWVWSPPAPTPRPTR